MKVYVYRKELIENEPKGFELHEIVPVAIDWDEARVCIAVSYRPAMDDWCTHDVWMHENVHNDGTSHPTVAYCQGHYDFKSEIEAMGDAYTRASTLIRGHKWMCALRVHNN